MPATISSRQNARIKEAIKLSKRRHRDEQQLTVVEGSREVERALAAGIIPTQAYICPKRCYSQKILTQLTALETERKTKLYEVTPDVFDKIAYREESGGILLTIPYFSKEITAISRASANFVAVVEGVEKPGNLGAIMRTADGAGVDAVITCSPPLLALDQHNGDPPRSSGPRVNTPQPTSGTDIHNPNAIRASLGTIFHVPIVQTTTASATRWLREQQIQIIATTPDGAPPYHQIDMRGPTAVVMGSEAHGLSDAWLHAADQRALIPMRGIADSLNLSTSTALLLYEVVRQRG